MAIEHNERETIDIIKLRYDGSEAIRYPARLLHFDSRWGYARVEAHFGFESADVGAFTIYRDDRMIEHFWSARHYNVFEVHAPGGALRGFYCNITRPADVSPTRISAEDLALDFVADVGGTRLVLDEEEFEELKIDGAERERARAALWELQYLYDRMLGPFAALDAVRRTSRGSPAAAATQAGSPAAEATQAGSGPRTRRPAE
ncbi:MAG: DUF402 domain-containing protein [Spirochaetales bacterium]